MTDVTPTSLRLQPGATFILSEDCELVVGAARAAIYDLRERKVYSVNRTGRAVLEAALGGTSLSQLDDTHWDFLQQLVALGLGHVEPDAPPSNKPPISCPPSKIEFMWLELTSRCNLKCIHCYGSFGGCHEELDAMKKDSWIRILHDGAELGCSQVQFIGGEPLLANCFLDLLQCAAEKGYAIDVFTNATLLTEGHIDQFVEHSVKVRVSIYGSTARIHDSITQVPGSFTRTTRALRLLHEAGIPTSIAVVAMKANQDDLESIGSYVKSLGHEYTGYDVIRTSDSPESRSLVPTDADVVASRMITEPRFRTDAVSFASNKYRNECWNGKIALTSNGHVIPCVFARHQVVANVTRQPLREVISGDSLRNLWSITKDSVEVCRDCEYRYACHDCRPLAVSEGGSMDAKYPRCTYDPYSGMWLNVPRKGR